MLMARRCVLSCGHRHRSEQSGIGGVPALFKSFTDQAGLSYEVFLETHPGVGLDWHLDNKRAIIDQRPWDTVVLQSFSTLDARKPGDPALLVSAVRSLAMLFRTKNPSVELRLTATWPRADLTYEPHGVYYGKPIEAMAHEVRAGYDLAAAKPRVLPEWFRWAMPGVRAFHSGVADGDPYDGIDAGKMDLWTYDNYHASIYGYYLEALMLFGKITGRDPRSLGDPECSAFELGIWPAQAAALQTVAFEALAADGPMTASPLVTRATGEPGRCASRLCEPRRESTADTGARGIIPGLDIQSAGSPSFSLSSFTARGFTSGSPGLSCSARASSDRAKSL